MSTTAIHHQFEKQAALTPDRTAVVFADERVTYAELNQRANQIAHRLRKNGLKEGEVVAVDASDSADTIAGMLGVLKAGGVYLPLDPDGPPARGSYILRHSQAAQLIQASSSPVHPEFMGPILALDELGRPKSNCANLRVEERTQRPFAISYQSDTTGQPEGITLSHENITGWAKFNVDQLKIDFSFTLFVSDAITRATFPLWLVALVEGGTVCFRPWRNGESVSPLLPDAGQLEITVAVLPLTLLGDLNRNGDFRQFFGAGLKNLVSVGDDLVRTEDLGKYLKELNIRWHNYFGFPEIQAVTTLVDETVIKHIGRPVSDTKAFVLDSERQLVPVGVAGDLYLSGAGCMAGYYKHPELDEQRFVESPFEPGSRIYRTGYKASWQPNRLLAFHGAADGRVNINRVRLALEEVEAAFNVHSAIDESAVLVRETPEGRPRLTAGLVINEPLAIEDLETHLRQFLPAAIFPIGYMQLSSLPRRAGGELDRQRLQELELLDSVDAHEIAELLKQEPGIKEVAVLIREHLEKRPASHLKNLISQISPNGHSIRSTSITVKSDDDQKAELPWALSEGGPLEEDDGLPRTLSQVLRRAAQNSPHGITYVSGKDSTHQTYQELLGESTRVCAWMSAAGAQRGDYVILQLDDNAQFLTAFWGCVLGGMVPVPLTTAVSYQQESSASRTLENVWELLERPLVLGSSSRVEEIRELLARRCQNGSQTVRVMGIEEAATAAETPVAEPEEQADEQQVALMLFTSGSTGKPKGVMLTHQNLISRSQATAQLNSFTSADVSLNLMPLAHVGGVVMFHLRDLVVGCEQVHVPTAEILAEPLRWLDLMDEHGATVTWAPNFAYGLINDELDHSNRGKKWDLSQMRFILNAGEAINAQTVKRFLQLLAEHGMPASAMHPAYGMSETSSAVTYSDSFTPEAGTGVHVLEKNSLAGMIRCTNDSNAESATFVEVGVPVPGINVRIVNADNQLVKEDTIGRLQIKGLSVTPGYYNSPELNRQTFVDDGWLLTGDLGFLHEGRLTITGREKDVIIVNGINYYSHEIEAVVEEGTGLHTSFTAACAIREAQRDTDGLAIFFSSEYAELCRQAEQINEIRQRVTQRVGITPDYIVPVAREQIPKTSIGKIQRSKLSEQFGAGAFNQVLEQIDVALENERTLPAWFFKKDWRPERLPGSTVGEQEPGTCLIFADSLGLAEALNTKLENDNHRCIQVEDGTEFVRLDDHHFTINRSDPQHYHRLIEALGEDWLEVNEILHLSNYTALSAGELDLQTLRLAQESGLYSLLYLVQAMAADPVHPVRLLAVTSNKEMTAPADVPAYEKSTITGFLKSIPLELSWLKCRQLDLEALDVGQDAERVCKELGAQVSSAEVAYRRGQRLVPFLSNLDVVERADREIPIKRGGIYLITGGLGGIGIHLATWLMKRYDARLIIVGRTVLPEKSEWKGHLEKDTVLGERIRNYAALEALGGEFLYEAGDLSDHSFLNDVVTRAESEWEWGERISGIFHLAGTLSRDGHPEESHWDTMEQQEAAVMRREWVESQLRAKVYGALTLAPLLEERPDAILVAFASVNSFFGGATLSAYAAANSFLESFCLYQSFQKRRSVFCLSWSLWDEVGIARDIPISLKAASRSAGYEAISVTQGLNSLAATLCGEQPHLYVGLESASRNVRRFIKDALPARQLVKVYYSPQEGFEFSDSHFQGLVLNALAQVDKKHRHGIQISRTAGLPLAAVGKLGQDDLDESAAQERSAAFEAGLPTTEVEKELLKIWQGVLGKSNVSVNDDFFALGGHSLLATKLLSRIAGVFQLEIPLRVLFESSTVRALAAYIERTRRSRRRGAQASLRPIDRSEELPLSFSQQRLWFMDQMQPGNPFYNVPAALRLSGSLHVRALEQSLAEIVRRHEVLRSVFPKVEGKPLQAIFGELQPVLSITDLSGLPEVERESEALRLASEEICRPFDLSQGPLIRASLLRLGETEHVLTLTMHHIVSDGWSVGIFVRELVTLYDAFSRGADFSLEELPIQYVDFASWQREWLQGDVLEKQLSYWKPQLGGRLPVLQLPTDGPRPLVQTFRGATKFFELPPSLSAALNTLSRQEGVTLFMTLLAAFKTLLYQYSRQDEIIVGTPIANRRHQEVEELIGFFVNSLVLRTDFSGNPNFRALLKRVREVALGAFAHQDMPFEYLVETLRPERDLSRSPLFQVMFVLQNTPREELQLPGLTLMPLNLHVGASKFDLTLAMEEADGKLLGSLEYNTDLFGEATIARLLAHFEHLLEVVTADPDWAVARLPRSEQSQYLIEWNETQADYPREECIHRLFEAQAEALPESLAIASQDAQLSYAELNRRANQLAHHLKNMGVGPEVAVAICVERSAEMVIGFLSILKAGGNYVPLDRSYPKERLALMLKDSRAAVLLTQQRLREILPEQEVPVLCLDADWKTIAGESAENPISSVTAANLAYIIYTSGSTGQPKGVAVTHANLLNLVTWHRWAYQVTPEDRATQVAVLGFDASVWELWPYLSCGASVFLPDEETRTTSSRFLAWLKEQRITLCFLPTPLAEVILAERMPAELSLRALLVGGDKLHRSPKDALPFDLVNHYGPTENTVVTTYTKVPTGVDSDEPPPIGRPIANTRIYLLDQYLEPVPVGVAGQLYIGGESLARGYHQDPGMTAEKFIPDPFSIDAGQRLYQTGDLVRYQTDGNLQFIGRVDHQVKIRGYRVELREIEILLSQHPAVRETIVLARGDGPGVSLVAYLVPEAATAPEVSDLRTYLGEKLPEYMVPSAFVVLSAMPLTANGKIDPQALPSPDQMTSSEDTAYVEPRTETERKVAGIWQELLEVERVGIHDNFFEIGGHSLLMVQAQSKLQDLFNRELTTIELFQYPTVHSLANFLDQEVPEASLAQESQDRAEMRRASMEVRRQAKYQADQTDGKTGQQADQGARTAVGVAPAKD